jgi:Tfp pilus assembly protein PilO
MPRNFNIRTGVKDPRVIMRVIIGALLAANLAAAVVAFKPFGGSAEDLRQEQQRLATQLSQLKSRIAASKRLVDKVQTARSEGDQFLNKYFMDLRTASTDVVLELNQTATEAGIKMGQAQFERLPIEGSDTLVRQTVTVGFEGTYANLTKFMHLVDKSPRFLIIENMQAAAPQGQGGQSLNVTLKIDAFIKDEPGAAL